MDYLQARGLVAPADRRPFLRGALVLVRPKRGRPLPRLADPGFVSALDGGRLAIGDPAHVPAGRYAEAALRHLGLWSALRERTAPMGSVREAWPWWPAAKPRLASSMPPMPASPPDVAIAEEIPAAAHPPILYPSPASPEPRTSRLIVHALPRRPRHGADRRGARLPSRRDAAARRMTNGELEVLALSLQVSLVAVPLRPAARARRRLLLSRRDFPGQEPCSTASFICLCPAAGRRRLPADPRHRPPGSDRRLGCTMSSA